MKIVALAVALLLGLTASAAHAGKGIFEAPMISVNSGAEVPGSEGKIERDGIVKVEVRHVHAVRAPGAIEHRARHDDSRGRGRAEV